MSRNTIIVLIYQLQKLLELIYLSESNAFRCGFIFLAVPYILEAHFAFHSCKSYKVESWA
jgi:hypothetical protein